MDFLRITKLFAQDYFAVPDYQRDYEWTNAQNSTLVEDVFEMMKDPNGGNHFIGAIVTIPYEKDNAINCCIDFSEYGIANDSVKHIVDGQQRLTSISILLQAIKDSIKEDQEMSTNDKDRQIDKFKAILQGNDYNSSDYIAPRLVLNGNTGYYYNNEVLGLNPLSFDKRYSGAKRVQTAYKLYKSTVLEQKQVMINDHTFNTASDFYKAMIDVLTKRIIFVEIECDESSNAFQVFDSLNGKGLDLTASDRIKNIMLSWSPKGKGAQHWDAITGLVGEEYLGSFFNSLMFCAAEKRVSKNKLPDRFKETYKSSATDDYNYFHNDLKEKAKLYGLVRNCRTSNKGVNALLEDIRQLKYEQVYVLIFAALIQYGESVIDDATFQKFLAKVITLIVRMQVCEKSSNRLDTVFSSCIKKMKNGSASLSVVISELNGSIYSITNDEEFKASFAKFTIADNSLAEYYLRKIEDYRREKQGNRSKVEKGLTVEHIIPVILDEPEDWYGDNLIPEEIKADFKNTLVERIANKLLLFGDDNSSASNNNYELKKQVYINGKRGQD